MSKNYLKLMASAAVVMAASAAMLASQPLTHLVAKATGAMSHPGIATTLPEAGQQKGPAIPEIPMIPKSAKSMAPMMKSDKAEVILYQDFSTVTEGSETKLGEDMVADVYAGDYDISSDYLGQDGWWGFGVFEAGGAVALAWPGSGGALNTPSMNMYGRLFVKIRVKAMEENTGDVLFYVNGLKGDRYNQQPINTLTQNQEGHAVNAYRVNKEDGWVEFTTMIYNFNDTDDCYIQINASSYGTKGLLLDLVEITRDYNLCTAPTDLRAYDFTEDGFTASWTPGMNNDAWYFSLMEEYKTGESESYSVNFDDVLADENGVLIPETLPGGVQAWLGTDGLQVSPDLGRDGAPALVLDNMEDMVVMPTNGMGLKSASFYAKSESYEGSYGMLWILAFRGDNVTVGGGVTLPSLMDGKEINMYDYVDGLSNYDAFGFMLYYPDEDEYVAISDIQWTTVAPTAKRLVMEDYLTFESEVPLGGLDPECDYSFSVKGASVQGFVSEATPYYQALGCPAPVLLPATDIDMDGAYSAHWVPSPKAEAYIVKNYKVTNILEDTPDCVIMEENFSGAATSSIDDVQWVLGESLDEIADLPGWTGNLGVFYADGGVGTMYGGDIVSPTLNLSGNGGKFKVRVEARVFAGYYFTVQCNMSSYQDVVAPGTQGEYELVPMTVELEFEDGTDNTHLMFYGTDGGFLINKVEVLQDLAAGSVLTEIQESLFMEGHDADECRFGGLEVADGVSYAYTVTAEAAYGSYIYHSEESAMMPVSFAETKVAATSATDGISVHGLEAYVTLSADSRIEICDIAGRVVAAVNGKAGLNTIKLPCAGAYIVKAAGKTMKTFAK